MSYEFDLHRTASLRSLSSRRSEPHPLASATGRTTLAAAFTLCIQQAVIGWFWTERWLACYLGPLYRPPATTSDTLVAGESRSPFARSAEPPDVDANQESRANPFGMDEECRNCPALCGTRERVVHGYGDVGADFLFVGEAPDPGAEAAGAPFAGGGADGGDGDEDGEWRVRDVLSELGLWAGEGEEGPVLVNTYLTYLARCRDPERPPTDEEVANCEPYLNAEIRMINPEILVPVGERALRELAAEYTTTPPGEFDLREVHATTVRGRGFELVPMLDPGRMDDADVDAFVEGFTEVMASDYRQTKGRRGR